MFSYHGLIVSTILTLVAGNVGFYEEWGDSAYLATKYSPDFSRIQFSFYGTPTVDDKVNLHSNDEFDIIALQRLIDDTDLDASLKSEMLDSLLMSFNSSFKSYEFLHALSAILGAYKNDKSEL